MSFQPRIYGGAGVTLDTFNLMPWRIRNARDGSETWSGQRTLVGEWSPPILGELTMEEVEILLESPEVRVVHWEPVWTPEGIVYCTTIQERIPLAQAETEDDHEG